MIRKIEHLGIAVKERNKAESVFQKLLDAEPYKQEEVGSENVNVSFFQVGESKLEFLEGTDESSAISQYIEKKGEGIQHMAFEVDDIHYEMERLGNAGFEILNDQPKEGADNKLICFLHPKQTNGVLVELCQDKGQ